MITVLGDWNLPGIYCVIAHISVRFISSKQLNGVTEESILTIDNLQTSAVLSDNARVARVDLNRIFAYPNPTLDGAIFDFPSQNSGFYRVYNNQGFLIETVNYKNTKRLKHNLHSLPSGQYIFRFYDEVGVRNVRVVKN